MSGQEYHQQLGNVLGQAMQNPGDGFGQLQQGLGVAPWMTTTVASITCPVVVSPSKESKVEPLEFAWLRGRIKEVEWRA